MKNRNLPRQALATGLAACAHLLVLLLMGWKVPRLALAGPAEDRAPPIEITLFRSATRPRPRSRTAPAAAKAAPALPLRSDLPTAAAPVTVAPPAPAAASPGLAAGASDCAPEDLVLLTEAEKTRCRNAIDADKGRQRARGADERLAKQVAKLKAVPRIDNIPAEKRAYYDAVAAAYDQQAHGPPMAGHLPQIACPMSIPLLSGVEINKNIFEKKKKGPCRVVPPQGMLTEEWDIPAP